MKALSRSLLALAITCAATAAKAQTFVYVSNVQSDSISAYVLDPNTGALSPVAGSPFPAGPNPLGGAVDRSGRFLYVTNYPCSYGCDYSPTTVSAFAIDRSSGALTPVAGSPFPAGVGPYSVSLDPSSRFAYVANAVSNDISAYRVDTNTGALTPIAGSPFLAGASPLFVTVDPLGKFAYVDNAYDNNVSVYSIDPSTGGLTPIPGSSVAAEWYPGRVSISPSGKFAYFANSTVSGSISAYSIDTGTGTLTPLPGSPFAAGNAPLFVVIDPSGHFAYAANAQSDDVSGFSIDPGTGVLAPIAGSPFAAGDAPQSIAMDPSGQFVYAANVYAGTISAYKRDSSTGALAAIGGSPFPAGSAPNGVTIVSFKPRAECTVQLSRTTYGNGDDVVVSRFRIANIGAVPAPIELKIWLGVPGFSPVSLVNAGANGSLILPVGFDYDPDPYTLFQVVSGHPRGAYELGCRGLDPVTGNLMAQGVSPFWIE